MKFHTFKNKAGEHQFNIVAANGEIVATGEGVKNKSDMLKTINAIKAGVPHARIVERKQKEK